MAQHSALGGDQLHKPKVATNAGDPTSSVTPDFDGQVLWDTTNNKLYRATGATSADWVQVTVTAKPHNLVCMPNMAHSFDHLAATTYRTPFSGTDPLACWTLEPFGHGVPDWSDNSSSSTWPMISCEDDGTGAHTAFWKFYTPDTRSFTAAPTTLAIAGTVPTNYSPTNGWATNGIRCQVLYVGNVLSGAGVATFRLEVYDPTTGIGYTTPVKTDRTITATTIETAYTWVTISGATLAGLFRPGDPLVIALSWGHASVGSGHATYFHVGRVEINWGG